MVKGYLIACLEPFYYRSHRTRKWIANDWSTNTLYVKWFPCICFQQIEGDTSWVFSWEDLWGGPVASPADRIIKIVVDHSRIYLTYNPEGVQKLGDSPIIIPWIFSLYYICEQDILWPMYNIFKVLELMLKPVLVYQ